MKITMYQYPTLPMTILLFIGLCSVTLNYKEGIVFYMNLKLHGSQQIRWTGTYILKSTWHLSINCRQITLNLSHLKTYLITKLNRSRIQPGQFSQKTTIPDRINVANKTLPTEFFQEEWGFIKPLCNAAKNIFGVCQKQCSHLQILICDFNSCYHCVYYTDIFYSRLCQTESFRNRFDNRQNTQIRRSDSNR